MELTDDERRLLTDLIEKDGTATITGNVATHGLDHLIEAGYLKSTTLNMGATLYEITEAGRAVIA